RRYSSFRLYHLLTLFVIYALALYVFGWGWAVQSILTVDVVGWPDGKLLLPGAELLLLAPLLAALFLSWVCYSDAERALYESARPLACQRPFWGRSAYVGFHLRQNLAMVLVPVVLLIVMQGGYRLYPELFNESWFQALSVAMLLVLIGFLPW